MGIARFSALMSITRAQYFVGNRLLELLLLVSVWSNPVAPFNGFKQNGQMFLNHVVHKNRSICCVQVETLTCFRPSCNIFQKSAEVI